MIPRRTSETRRHRVSRTREASVAFFSPDQTAETRRIMAGCRPNAGWPPRRRLQLAKVVLQLAQPGVTSTWSKG